MELTLFFILALLSGSAIGVNNGVARTPPMGWNPYYVYLCSTHEDQYRAAARALFQTGLRDLGYIYMVMDCGWQANARTPSGLLAWDTTRIPSGVPALSTYVHGLGLRFGVYSTAGYYSCDSDDGADYLIGSLGHESADAEMFQEWQADYLKYGNCYAVSPTDFIDLNPPPNLEQSNYQRMGDVLGNMVYSICEWGLDDAARWAGGIGNSWQISFEIGPSPSFESLRRVINQFVPYTTFTRPGSWNDLDMLVVGHSSLTPAEWKTQFAFWSAAKSPLLISTDLTTISEEAMSILSNERVIRQDPLGVAISFKRRYTDSYDVWGGLLADGSTVAVFLNWKDTAQTITINLADLTFASADVLDLWTGTDLGTVNEWTTASLDAHGTLIYKLSNTVLAPTHPTRQIYYASNSQYAGGANPRTLIDGSTVVIGNIGYTGTLTFTSVDGGSNGSTKLVRLAYVNADVTYVNTDCPNCRRVEVSVNGGPPVVAECPLSGSDWSKLFQAYPLSLDGFNPGPVNNIVFSNPVGWAPDMYSMIVEG